MDSKVSARTWVVIWCVVVLGCYCGVSNGVVYKVGDNSGWTTIGNVDYRLWAQNKTFQIEDQIVFEYNPQFHNVMQLNTHADYRSCNVSSPVATYTTGNDTIDIKTPGHHFFVCGVPGHCQAGQKVDINVPADATTGVQNGPSSGTPLAPPVAVPAPSRSSAAWPSATFRKLLLGWAAWQIAARFCFDG